LIKFEKSIQIDRLQQEIFDFVSDPANTSKWQDAIQTAEWTSVEPIGIGSTQYSISRLFGRIFVSLPEITLWDPPNQYIFKNNNPFSIEDGMMLELKDYGTKVTMRGHAEPGVFFKLPEESFGKQMEKVFETNLEALKLSLEANLT
jgi:hypothetical protein